MADTRTDQQDQGDWEIIASASDAGSEISSLDVKSLATDDNNDDDLGEASQTHDEEASQAHVQEAHQTDEARPQTPPAIQAPSIDEIGTTSFLHDPTNCIVCNQQPAAATEPPQLHACLHCGGYHYIHECVYRLNDSDWLAYRNQHMASQPTHFPQYEYRDKVLSNIQQTAQEAGLEASRMTLSGAMMLSDHRPAMQYMQGQVQQAGVPSTSWPLIDEGVDLSINIAAGRGDEEESSHAEVATDVNAAQQPSTDAGDLISFEEDSDGETNRIRGFVNALRRALPGI